MAEVDEHLSNQQLALYQLSEAGWGAARASRVPWASALQSSHKTGET